MFYFPYELKSTIVISKFILYFGFNMSKSPKPKLTQKPKRAKIGSKRLSVSEDGNEKVQMEEYFIKKIKCYMIDFKENLETIEKELEDTKLAYLNCLVKIKKNKDRISELEVKNDFYKKRLAKYEKDESK